MVETRFRELGASQSDIRVAIDRMKLDYTVPIDTQLGWLREAGFSEVSCAYKNLIFAVYCGRK